MNFPNFEKLYYVGVNWINPDNSFIHKLYEKIRKHNFDIRNKY